jgi:hypothetical protein
MGFAAFPQVNMSLTLEQGRQLLPVYRKYCRRMRKLADDAAATLSTLRAACRVSKAHVNVPRSCM